MTTVVNFELAKLLEQKGFDDESAYYYNEKGEMLFDKDFPSWQSTKPDSYYDAPTIAEVCMWLYEKHNIWVNVYLYKDHAADVNDDYMFRSNYTKIWEYKTPEQAYEAAIEYVLNNMI